MCWSRHERRLLEEERRRQEEQREEERRRVTAETEKALEGARVPDEPAEREPERELVYS